jgi:hypothetical protein
MDGAALLQTVALKTTILARPFIEPDAARASSTPSFHWQRETGFTAKAVAQLAGQTCCLLDQFTYARKNRLTATA